MQESGSLPEVRQVPMVGMPDECRSPVLRTICALLVNTLANSKEESILKTPFAGQCMCGSVQYTCESEPKFSLLCQCTQCQKITGAGHAAQFAVDANKTAITGSVETFDLVSDAGNAVASAFCPICGNPIYKTTSMMPDTFVFHAGTLNEPSAFRPQFVVYSCASQPWDQISPEIDRKT